MTALSKAQARRFLLLKHGLLGPYRFKGKRGALEYIRQAGCIQFDPVDVCGKNAELILQARVQGFKKSMLRALLYEDRALVDYPDKQLSIWPVEDWPYFAGYRAAAKAEGAQFAALQQHLGWAKNYIAAHGPVSAEELPLSGKLPWHSAIHWSGNWGGESNAARSVLEQLYTTGELVVHHKMGARKVYDLAERHIPKALLEAENPLPAPQDHIEWRVLRRIGAVGLLWNAASEAWLGIGGMKAAERSAAFSALFEKGEILPAAVEGLRAPLYYRAADVPLLEKAQSGERFAPRCALLAPLDCLLWDKKLLRALFGFDYTWEIYTPQEKRKYGAYVLPMVYGERFIGRAEAVPDRKSGVLRVRNIWYEDGVRETKALRAGVERCMRRFAAFNGCAALEMPGGSPLEV